MILKELKLKKGQLLRLWGDTGRYGGVIQYLGGKYIRITGGLGGYKPECWAVFDHWGEAELTTAYDSGIDPSDLPIPEPIDSTGWVVYNGEKYAIAQVDGMYDIGNLILSAEHMTSGIDLAIKDCQPCLPPVHEAVPEWTPKDGELVWLDKKGVKGRIVLNPANDELSILYYIDSAEEWYLRPLGKFERLQGKVQPYTGQDTPKIDFGKAGLVLKWRDGLYLTSGSLIEDQFICYDVRTGETHEFSVDADYEDVTDKFNDLLSKLSA